MKMAPDESVEEIEGGDEAKGLNLARVLKLELQVSVLIAEKEVLLGEVLGLGPGNIVEFDRPSGEAFHILIGEKVIGRGDVVKVGENYGVVVKEIGGVRERIEQLGSL